MIALQTKHSKHWVGVIEAFYETLGCLSLIQISTCFLWKGSEYFPDGSDHGSKATDAAATCALS